MSVLNDHVLVLNKYYLAVQVATVMDAVKILYKDHGKVVDDNYRQYTFAEWVERCKAMCVDPAEVAKYAGEVRSSSLFIYAPQVIYLPNNEAESPEIRTIKFSRKSVFERDNFTCQYCGHKKKKEELSMDHVLPRSRGGPSNFTNIVTACKPCNAWKDNQTPEEAGMALLKKPTAPRWKSHIGTPFSKVKKDYWNLFLKQ
jgi:hypothetical protein